MVTYVATRIISGHLCSYNENTSHKCVELVLCVIGCVEPISIISMIGGQRHVLMSKGKLKIANI